MSSVYVSLNKEFYSIVCVCVLVSHLTMQTHRERGDEIDLNLMVFSSRPFRFVYRNARAITAHNSSTNNTLLRLLVPPPMNCTQKKNASQFVTIARTHYTSFRDRYRSDRVAGFECTQHHHHHCTMKAMLSIADRVPLRDRARGGICFHNSKPTLCHYCTHSSAGQWHEFNQQTTSVPSTEGRRHDRLGPEWERNNINKHGTDETHNTDRRQTGQQAKPTKKKKGEVSSRFDVYGETHDIAVAATAAAGGATKHRLDNERAVLKSSVTRCGSVSFLLFFFFFSCHLFSH